MIALSRETSEHLIPSMFVEGVAVDDFEVAICSARSRPTAWISNPGPKIAGLDPGWYRVYGRCTRDGQTYVRRLDAPNDDDPAGLLIT